MAQRWLAERYDCNVYFDVEYSHYWKRSNVSPQVLQFLGRMRDRCGADYKKRSVRSFKLRVNHPRHIFSRRDIVIDDGVGAYRGNPLALLSELARERAFNGERSFSLRKRTSFVLRFIMGLARTAMSTRKISIFKRSLLDYYGKNESTAKYFIEAIAYLSHQLPANDSFQGDLVIYLSTPTLTEAEPGKPPPESLAETFTALRQRYPSAQIVVKRHPMDDASYDCYGVITSADDIPAEVMYFRYRKQIQAVVGVSSTSLLVGQVLFNLDAFTLSGKKPTEDWHVNRGFQRWTSQLPAVCPDNYPPD